MLFLSNCTSPPRSPLLAAPPSAPAADHPHANDRGSNGPDDDRQHDGADHDDGRVAHRFVFRTLHQARQAQIQKVEAVQPSEDRQGAQQRQDVQHRRHPRRRVGIHGHLERQRAVFLAAEVRGQRVDDEREDEDADDRHGKGETGEDEAAGEGCAIRADERQGSTDHRAADKTGHRSDGRERHHVAGDQAPRGCRLGGDDRPFGVRRQTDVLDAVNDTHQEPPLHEASWPLLPPCWCAFCPCSQPAPDTAAVIRQRGPPQLRP